MTTLRIGYYIVVNKELLFAGEKLDKAGDAIWIWNDKFQAKLPYFESEISVILHQTEGELEILHFEEI